MPVHVNTHENRQRALQVACAEMKCKPFMIFFFLSFYRQFSGWRKSSRVTSMPTKLCSTNLCNRGPTPLGWPCPAHT